MFKDALGVADGTLVMLITGSVTGIVMFADALGVADGTLVMLMTGSVTGIVMLAEALGIVTDKTVVPVPVDRVKFPPVGGITTVSVTGMLEVTLLEGPGMLTDGGGAPVVAGIDMFANGVVWVNVPVPGVELAGVVEFTDAGGIDVLTPELVSGKGDRGWSELVPVDPRLEVMFKLALGVALGGIVTVIFELPLGVALGGIGIVTVMFKLAFGVTLGGIGIVTVMFKLALGVTLGRTTTVEFEGITIASLTVELVRGKGERGWSELVPIEPKLVVMLTLALGVTLGGTVIDEFEGGTMRPLTDELVSGNGDRG
jgi:hypothetical protein